MPVGPDFIRAPGPFLSREYKCRYIGKAKTHLQHVLTAAAINFVRVSEWLDGTPVAKTRRSAFAGLMAPAA